MQTLKAQRPWHHRLTVAELSQCSSLAEGGITKPLHLHVALLLGFHDKRQDTTSHIQHSRSSVSLHNLSSDSGILHWLIGCLAARHGHYWRLTGADMLHCGHACVPRIHVRRFRASSRFISACYRYMPGSDVEAWYDALLLSPSVSSVSRSKHPSWKGEHHKGAGGCFHWFLNLALHQVQQYEASAAGSITLTPAIHSFHLRRNTTRRVPECLATSFREGQGRRPATRILRPRLCGEDQPCSSGSCSAASVWISAEILAGSLC